MMTAALADWNNFYVITGSAAAGLTGLTFVVIALAADAERMNPTGLRAFVSPTIVHFGSVLALSAFLCVPGQITTSASIGLGAGGLAGLIYTGIIASNIGHNLGSYTPVLEDWIWNAILPFLAYGALLAMAYLIWWRLEPCLYGVAAVSVSLLFVGIHNAWDIAVWMTLRKHDAPAQASNQENETKER